LSAGKIPDRAGAGFRTAHTQDILDHKTKCAWFEVHPENYLVDGGPRLQVLERLCLDFPVSFHGLALSLAGFERPDKTHLKALKTLIERFEPGLVSEHLAWSALGDHYFADLLPVPYTREALEALVRNVCEVQEALGRRILIENPARYLELPGEEMSELEFITEVAHRAGCGILFDVNNAYVTQQNLGTDAAAYTDALDPNLIGEVHLAGYSVDQASGCEILIDSHSAPVSEPVWDLFRRLLDKAGPKPVLVEWDNDIPEWAVLESEVEKADQFLLSKAAEAAE